MGTENWDPELDTNYDIAMESWASIKKFFEKYGGKVSGAFKSLWNKLDKNQRALDNLKSNLEKTQNKRKELMERLTSKGVPPAEKSKLRLQINAYDRDIAKMTDQKQKLENFIKFTAEEAEKARKLEMRRFKDAAAQVERGKELHKAVKDGMKVDAAAAKAKVKREAAERKALGR